MIAHVTEDFIISENSFRNSDPVNPVISQKVDDTADSFEFGAMPRFREDLATFLPGVENNESGVMAEIGFSEGAFLEGLLL